MDTITRNAPTRLYTMDEVYTTQMYEIDTTGYVYYSNTVLVFVTTLSINLAMGCTLELIDVKRQMTTLGGILAGCLSQFLVFPALTYLLSHVFSVSGSSSIGLALMASCPGSALTSIVTYYVDGDVYLSFCLTVICSAVSIGVTPAMAHIYTRSWTHRTLHVALWPMASMLFLHMVPPIIGYLINMKKKNLAKRINKVCSVIGLLSFNINCIMQIVANHRHLSQITWGFVMTTLLLPLLGWGGANLLAWMFQQSIQKRRTIGVEILMHNVALTVVILGTAFYNFEHKLEIAAGLALQGPISGLYGLLMVFIFSFLHRSHSEAAGRMPRVELPNLSGNGSVINHDDGDVRTQPVVQESNKANIATYLQQETVKGGITESAL